MSEPIKTKQCSKCKEIKPVSEFRKSKARKDGYHNPCRNCISVWHKTYHQTENRKRRHREYMREYRKTEKDRIYQKQYRQSKKGREAHERYCLANQDKRRAKITVSIAVKAGKLAQINTLKCSCGKQAAHYHHPDYSKPLDVTPICHACHGSHRVK